VRFVSVKANVNQDQRFTYVFAEPPGAQPHWDEAAVAALDPAGVSRSAPPGVHVAGSVPGELVDPKNLYRTAAIAVLHNPTLKLYSRPGQPAEEFRAACQREADTRRAADLDKIRAKYDKKIDALQDRRDNERRDLDRNQAELRSREAESRWTTAENLLGLALGKSSRRIMSGQESKKRMAERARNEVEESRETMASLDAQIAELKAEAQSEFQAVAARWASAAQDVQELRLTPKKADILVELFGLGWVPHWQMNLGGQELNLPAYGV
jgi:hypothetical protein